MEVAKIYEKYKVMPQLELHMFKAAGVASIICDNLDENIDKKTIISACLLHDIGNIVKFDLNWTNKLYPQLQLENSIDYWKKIKTEYMNKFGTDANKATISICKELKVNNIVIKLIENMGFSNVIKIYKDDKFDVKICEYADMRVKPAGICSLKDRIDDGVKRYHKKDKNHRMNKKQLDLLISYLNKIEDQIFLKSKIKPSDINEDSVKNLVNKFKSFDIATG